MTLRSAVSVFLLLLSRAVISSAQTQAGAASGVSLAPGDVIRIEVWQQKEYSCECAINTDGTISHPLYRELKITDLPLPEVEARLRAFLSRYLSNPTFEIQPLLRVVVAGEVRQPNVYPVPPGTSVAQVVFRAGGPTDRGRLEDVRLVRSDGSSLKLDLTRPDVGTSRVEVHSGDQILVGRRRSLMQDVIAPTASILAAFASVTAVIIQVKRR